MPTPILTDALIDRDMREQRQQLRPPTRAGRQEPGDELIELI